MESNETDLIISKELGLSEEAAAQIETATVENTELNDELTSSVRKMRSEGLMMLFKVFKTEANEFMLDMKQRKALREALGVEKDSADSWRTAADVVKHFDSVELIRKYPDQAKSTLLSVMSIFPPTAIAAAFISQIPADKLSKILGVSLTVSPDHLLHMLTDHQSNVVAQRNALYKIDAPPEEGKRDLVIVCKDDLLFDQLKKLVNTDDDEEDGTVIGTKDGTVRILRWDEKKWLYRSKGDPLPAKALLIGDIKGTENGLNLMDTKFEKHGVRYGWADGRAYIAADRSVLRSRSAYGEFLSELKEMPLPDIIKRDGRMKFGIKTGLKIALATPLIAKDIYDDSRSVLRQMYFYGAMRFYYDHLEEFLES